MLYQKEQDRLHCIPVWAWTMKTDSPGLNLGYAPYYLCDVGIVIYAFALNFLSIKFGFLKIYLLGLL